MIRSLRTAAFALACPVVSRDAGERIAMTVPVVTGPAGGDRHVMQFVLPARFATEGAPVPTDPTVRVREIEARWVAALTYSGRSDEGGFIKHEADLLARVRSAGLTVTGPPQFAVYNSPFTP